MGGGDTNSTELFAYNPKACNSTNLPIKIHISDVHRKGRFSLSTFTYKISTTLRRLPIPVENNTRHVFSSFRPRHRVV